MALNVVNEVYFVQTFCPLSHPHLEIVVGNASSTFRHIGNRRIGSSNTQNQISSSVFPNKTEDFNFIRCASIWNVSITREKKLYTFGIQAKYCRFCFWFFTRKREKTKIFLPAEKQKEDSKASYCRTFSVYARQRIISMISKCYSIFSLSRLFPIRCLSFSAFFSSRMYITCCWKIQMTTNATQYHLKGANGKKRFSFWNKQKIKNLSEMRTFSVVKGASHIRIKLPNHVLS